MEQIQLGAKGRYEMAVNRMVSAAAVKDGLLEVFGTPFFSHDDGKCVNRGAEPLSGRRGGERGDPDRRDPQRRNAFWV